MLTETKCLQERTGVSAERVEERLRLRIARILVVVCRSTYRNYASNFSA